MQYAIEFRADIEGDWVDHPTNGRELRFASEDEALAWWAAHYRGPDIYGNKAHPTVVEATDEE